MKGSAYELKFKTITSIPGCISAFLRRNCLCWHPQQRASRYRPELWTSQFWTSSKNVKVRRVSACWGRWKQRKENRRRCRRHRHQHDPNFAMKRNAPGSNFVPVKVKRLQTMLMSHSLFLLVTMLTSHGVSLSTIWEQGYKTILM